MFNWLKRLMGGSDSSTSSETVEPVTAPEPTPTPTPTPPEPPAPPVEPAPSAEEPAGDQPA